MRIDPDDVVLRLNLGNRLLEAGRHVEAVEHFKKGYPLAQETTDRLEFRKGLKRCHFFSGDVEALGAIWRKSLEIEPPDQEELDEYAEYWLYLGRRDEYFTTCRKLIDHFGATEDSRLAERIGRASLLSPSSKEVLEKATALIDRALTSKNPKPAWVHPYFMFAKGLAEYRNGRLESSIEIMDGPARTALQPAPRLVSAMALHHLGREEEALRTLSKAILSMDWTKSKANDREKWIYHVLRREAESMILPNLSAFLEGKYRPLTHDESICFLGGCQFEGRYRTAANIYSLVLASDARIANDLYSKIRYVAASTAASVGAGRGFDASELDETERRRWRNQARDWLRADLNLARKLSESKAAGLRDFLSQSHKSWLTEPELAPLRDLGACKGLLQSEQQEFRVLCEDLRILAQEAKN